MFEKSVHLHCSVAFFLVDILEFVYCSIGYHMWFIVSIIKCNVAICTSEFCCFFDRILDKKNLKKDWLVVAQVWRCYHGGKGMNEAVGHMCLSYIPIAVKRHLDQDNIERESILLGSHGPED